MKRLFALLFLSLVVPLSVAMAQTTNPSVVYEGVTIEIEPDKGPVQVCIVKTVTTKTLNETTVSTQGIIIAHNTDKWIVSGVFDDDATGKDVGNDVGDCGSIQWEN